MAADEERKVWPRLYHGEWVPSAPAAPLEKAVAEAREVLAGHPVSVSNPRNPRVAAEDALRALLAALDADPWQTARLEAEADAKEAESIIRTIVENHFARITERGVLVYGQPVAYTGFAAAIHWLARRDAEKGERP